MADEPKTNQGKRWWFPFPVIQWTKGILRTLKFPVKDVPEPGFELTDIQIYDNLRNEINFGTIQQLNNLMWQTEVKWEGVSKEDPSHAGSAAGKMKEMIEVYTRGYDAPSEPDNHNKGIGPFTDPDEVVREGNYLASGTGFDSRAWIALPLSNGRKKYYKYHLPVEQKFRHGPLEYNAAFFGERSINDYVTLLFGDIKRMIDDYTRVLKEGKTPEQQNNIDANIEVIRERYYTAIKAVEERIREFEGKIHYKLVAGRTTVRNMFPLMEDIKKEIRDLRLPPDQVHYQHTYRIIDMYKEIVENGRIIRFADAHPNWEVRGKEVFPGLDENGMPLEVGDGRTAFRDGILKENEIVIDHYENYDRRQKGKSTLIVRRVNPRFVTDCHPIDIAVWVYVHYDSYRDDMRDGRYHKDSMSIMEYLMENLDPLEPKNVRDYVQKPDFEKGKHAKVRITLNKQKNLGEEGKYRPDNDPNQTHVKITSTHLNPAFDKRAEGKTIHRGRKYYYDVQDNSEQSTEPTLTTRGAALYILHRVIDQTRYWGGTGDKDKQGILELLAKIADQTSGYDIGPNLGRWGKPLTKNPFNPDQSG